jgi:hypothetical protein
LGRSRLGRFAFTAVIGKKGIMPLGDKVAVAHITMKQGIFVAIISGVFGLLASVVQIAISKPATEGKVLALFDKRLPVGTIVASIIEPRQFAKEAGDSGNFDPRTSTWVPADGRDVAGSFYAERVTPVTPDLRGMFLRGLNYTDSSRLRSDGRQEPGGDARKAGQDDPDDFKSHTHPMADTGATGAIPGGIAHVIQSSAQRGPSSLIGDSGGTETRPRNVAVFYYLKIN